MKNIYNALPAIFQDAAVSFAGYKQKIRRYDKGFYEKLDGYVKRDSLSRDELFAFRNSCIKKSLEQAAKTEFYSNVFKEMGAHWTELCTPENFEKIPLTYKSNVAKNPSAFMPRNKIQGDIGISTSGTTGQSLSFNASRSFDSEQWAVWWRFRYRFGIKI